MKDLQLDSLFGQHISDDEENESSNASTKQASMPEDVKLDGDLSTALIKIRTNDTVVDGAKLEARPKKFTEDEKRETGAIKVSIYKEYLSTAGGIWFWTPIIVLFGFYQALLLGRVCCGSDPLLLTLRSFPLIADRLGGSVSGLDPIKSSHFLSLLTPTISLPF